MRKIQRFFAVSSVVALFAATTGQAIAATDPAAEQPATSTQAVQATQDMDVDELVAAIQRYEATSPGGQPYFDTQKAILDGAPAEVIEAGELYNLISAGEGGDLGKARVNFRFYGNWCGPGHSGPGAPIDWIDEACKRHDECYARDGYNDCICDFDLLRTLREGQHRPMNWHQRAVVAAIIAWFERANCVDHGNGIYRSLGIFLEDAVTPTRVNR